MLASYYNNKNENKGSQIRQMGHTKQNIKSNFFKH
jgi:hypothetical protein